MKHCGNCVHNKCSGTFCGWDSYYCEILNQGTDFQIMEQEARENLQETWEDMQDCIKDQLFAFCDGDEKELERYNSALNQATTAYQKASKRYEKYTR